MYVVICFKIRIFAQRQTSNLVQILHVQVVVICFKIRIFAQRQTSDEAEEWTNEQLWFALKFVSLHKDKHPVQEQRNDENVVICFKIRIFAQRQTSIRQALQTPQRCDLL